MGMTDLSRDLKQIAPKYEQAQHEAESTDLTQTLDSHGGPRPN